MSRDVDAARNFVNLLTKEGNVMDLCTMLQDAAQSWEHLLTTSGRKLNLEKCTIYIISWNFKEDGTPTMDKTSIYQIPIIYSTDETISYVNYLYPDESILYLGHSSQPDDNQQNVRTFYLTMKNHLRDVLF